MTTERETWNDSDHIECPWCGHVGRYDDLYMEDEETEDVECHSCEKEFEIRASVSVDYRATRIDDETVRLRAEYEKRRQESIDRAIRAIKGEKS